MDGATTTLDPMTEPADQTDANAAPSDGPPRGKSKRAAAKRPARGNAAKKNSRTKAKKAAKPDTDESSTADAAPEESPDASTNEIATPSESDAPIEILPQRVVEAILFCADTPLPAPKIASILGVGDGKDVRKHIAALNAQYVEWGVSFRIQELAGGFQMLTQPAYNAWLSKLLKARQETKLSPAAMETLSIVAYKQPCTRADVEAIRGVAAGDMLNRLREMNVVKIVGRAEDLGRPLLYGTTKRFLEVFGLPSLKDLPEVEAFGSPAPRSEPANDSNVSDATDEPVEYIPRGDDVSDEMEAPSLSIVRDDSDATDNGPSEE